MDFQTLNRRELQFLCKLNKIPANITNIAMIDALKSLETVIGIEEIMNPSVSETAGSSIELPEKIEVISPRVPRTSCRTSTRQKVKKSEAESLMVTPSVFSTRKKALTTSCKYVESQPNECEEVANNECLVDQEMCIPNTPVAIPTTYSRRKGTTTSTRQDTVKKENTVQRVYSTRRSARLTEKKCAEPGVVHRERSPPVKIDSFLEEASVTSEEDLGNLVLETSVGFGSGSIEASDKSNMWTTEGNVGEGSVNNSDAGVSKEKVDDICHVFEKLDFLVVDENDQTSVVDKANGCVEFENLKGEEKADGCVEFENLKGGEKADDCVEFDNLKVKSIEIIEQHENEDLEEKHIIGEKFGLNEDGNSEEMSSQVDILKLDSEGISNLCEDGDSEEKFTAIDEKICPDYLIPEEHLIYDKVLSEADDINVDAISLEMKNPSNPLAMGSRNMLEDVFHNNHNVAKEMTAEPEGMEENISRNKVDAVLVNPNEQELKDFETLDEEQESLIKETAVDIKPPTIYQEIQEIIIDADKATHESSADAFFTDEENQFLTNANVVFDHPTHLTPIKNQILSNSPTSIRGITDNNENSGRNLQEVIVEEDKTINKKHVDEKPVSLNETSIRQLKKQLKALSIKNNMNTNEDITVTEARPVLQVVCDNQLATGEDN